MFYKKIIKKIKIINRFSKELAKYYLLYPFSLIYRKKNIWIVAERGNDARDNGLHMFRFLRENHPELEVYYVITKDSPDRKNVEPYGNIIDYGSLKHYLIFTAAEMKIATHIMGFSPNRDFYTTMLRYLHIKGKTVFLQHGVTHFDLRQLYADKTKLDLFICGAKPEFDYIDSTFGYKNDEVKYTGLARFDNLYDFKKKDQILLMPTWRRTLAEMMKQGLSIKDTEYVKNWNSLLKNPKLLDAARKANIDIIFYPHIEVQKQIDLFESTDEHVIIASFRDYDVQQLLKDSALLITDSSSVHFDFAYMMKPCLYYQFDFEEFLKRHYAKGYFDYPTMAFGEVTQAEGELVDLIISYINSGFAPKEEYLRRVKAFFPLHDRNNCRRIYDEIIKLEKNEKKS